MFNLLVLATGSDAGVLFREDFSSPVSGRSDVYETFSSPVNATAGSLVLRYPIMHGSFPAGVGCTLPFASASPDEREIEMNFLGGGSQMSNSLFIGYACGPGIGPILPPLASGNMPGNRSGYIVRYIRHGDGSNEVKFYRSDTGSAVELLCDTMLSSNPISTLRRTVIRHRRDGEHVVISTFDTGTLFEKTHRFRDNFYPPGNSHRGLQVVAKGHVSTDLWMELRTDTWIVTDRAFGPAGSPPPRPASGRMIRRK